jgi:steroid delta-isomerase-like uncharacterized protein
MSAQANVTIARRFFAEQDQRKGSPSDDLCAPGYMAYVPGFPPMDFAAHAELGKTIYAAFPDAIQTIEDAFGDDEKAVLRFTITGTHQGELMGMPATGKPIAISAIATFRIIGGKVAELHEIFDQMGMMQQLGAMPAP